MTTNVRIYLVCAGVGFSTIPREGVGVVVVQFRLEEELELEEGGQEKRGMKTSCRPISERRQTEEEQRAIYSNQVPKQTR